MTEIYSGQVSAKCPKCNKFVTLNKPLLGSLHFCVIEKELK